MRRRLRAGIILLFLALAALSSCGASGAPSSGASGRRHAGPIALKKIGNFGNPVYLTGAPGSPNLLFVVEQTGKVVVLRGGHPLRRPFLDISGLVSFEGERGLLSIAFPPDYARSGRFYAYYTDKKGNLRIDEFHRRSQTLAAIGSRRGVIEIPHPVNANHNGGQMQFLGDLLYFGTGDGGSAGDPPNNAQNKNVLLGKLLRIDPRPSGGRPYTVPASNPFVGKPGRDEIYSYGLRNPFRFSFDRASAQSPRIVIGDVGQNRFEEVDYTTVAGASGANFGWDAFEGFAPYREENGGTPDPGGTVKPIFAYSHSRNGSCAIVGGYVVHDPRLPSLQGRYLYSDYCEGGLHSLLPRLGRARDDHRLGLSVQSPTSFGEDDRGRIYVCSQLGPVYRLVPR
ncbi:MAG: PQQ-dependent sugar dehydrogenase [Solirubrobacterales bacterium]